MEDQSQPFEDDQIIHDEIAISSDESAEKIYPLLKESAATGEYPKFPSLIGIFGTMLFRFSDSPTIFSVDFQSHVKSVAGDPPPFPKRVKTMVIVKEWGFTWRIA